MSYSHLTGKPGTETLQNSVIHDCQEKGGTFSATGCTNCPGVQCFHKYCDKYAWIIDRAKKYADKLNLTPEQVLEGWEQGRKYWYMNYYQECMQPEIKSETVRVFETTEEFNESTGSAGYRCPSCGKVALSPTTCKHCDWKSYGLFGTMGKGITVYIKSTRRMGEIFLPIAWEDIQAESIKPE